MANKSGAGGSISWHYRIGWRGRRLLLWCATLPRGKASVCVGVMFGLVTALGLWLYRLPLWERPDDRVLAAPVLMTILVSTLVSVVAAVASYFLAPRPKAPGMELNMPSAEDGVPIPLIFGTYETAGHHIWPRVKATMPKARNEGKWRASWATAIGFGPIEKLWWIRWDDCRITEQSHFPPEDPTQPAVIETNLKSGKVRFYFGAQNTTPDPHIVAAVTGQLSNVSAESTLNQFVPSWGNIAYAVYEMAHIGMTATIPVAHYRVTRRPQPPIDASLEAGLDPAYRMIGDHANPVHALAEVLCNQLYGAGLPVELIDWPSWNDVAVELHREGLGISGALQQTTKLEDFIRQILYHIDGVLIRRGEKWVLRLVRSPAGNTGDKIIVPQDIISAELQISSPLNTVNHVSVEFPDANRDFRPTTVPVFDAGNANLRYSARRETLRFPYFTELNIATMAANRKMQMFLVGHDSLKLTLRRRAGYDIEVGDVLNVIYTPLGVGADRLWRVTEVVTHNVGARGYCTVNCIEEIPMASFTAPQEDPTPPPPPGGGGGEGGNSVPMTPVTYQLPMEIPRGWAEDEVARFVYLGNREQLLEEGFILWGKASDPQFVAWKSDCAFTIAGVANITNREPELERVTGITVYNCKGVTDWEDFYAAFTVDSREMFYQSPTYYAVLAQPNPADTTGKTYWATELIAFNGIAYLGLSGGLPVYKLQNIRRRLFDTEMLSGQCLVFVFRTPPFVITGRPEMTRDNLVTFKMQPYSGVQVSPLTQMSEHVFRFMRRAASPYPVCNVMIDGNGTNPVYTPGQPFRVSWIARNRNGGFGISGTFEENSGLTESLSFIVIVTNPATEDILLEVDVGGSSVFTDGYGVTRHYHDCTITADVSSLRVEVRSKVGTLTNVMYMNAQQVTVRRA